VDGDVFRKEEKNLFQRVRKARLRVRGQPRDQIHVIAIPPTARGKFQRVEDFLRRVPAADGL
jgi:hypothetical protein